MSGMRSAGSPAASRADLPPSAGSGSVGQRSTIAAAALFVHEPAADVGRRIARQLPAPIERLVGGRDGADDSLFRHVAERVAGDFLQRVDRCVERRAFVDREFEPFGAIGLPAVNGQDAGHSRHVAAAKVDARFGHRPIEQHERVPRPRLIALGEQRRIHFERLNAAVGKEPRDQRVQIA